ncbi:MAG: DsbA family protein [Eubacteriales bacterium]|nr:DsbA family protein [Eubacteriales bacterium]
MNKKVKVYFDFLCPFCYKGVMNMIELMPEFPELMVDWVPCEAHPRPEKRSLYSDIAAEAFLYIKGHKGDMISFIKAVFRAYYVERKSIDDKEVLLECAKDANVELDRFRASLTRRDYKQDVISNNETIWNIYDAEAVPSFYCRNKQLLSRENRMISKEELRDFLASL